MSVSFEFATATRIIFGAGRLRELGTLVNPFGKRALIVTGRDPARAQPLCTTLSAAGVEYSLFSVTGEPEVRTVQNGAAQAKDANSDVIISFGGGSAIDAGKAIAAMLTNDGDLLDFLEVIGR